MLTLLRDSFSSCVALFFARFDFSKISTEPVPFVFSFRVLVFGAKSFLFAESEKKKSIIIKKAVDDDDDATSATAVPPTKVRARVRAK